MPEKGWNFISNYSGYSSGISLISCGDLMITGLNERAGDNFLVP